MLFNRSVRDNIALADPAMPMERVIEASFGYGTVFPSYSTHQVPSASKAATRGNVRQWELRAPQKQRAPTKAPLHQQLMGNHAERIEKCATKNVDRKIASVRKVANAHEPLSFSSIISVTKRRAGSKVLTLLTMGFERRS